VRLIGGIRGLIRARRQGFQGLGTGNLGHLRWVQEALRKGAGGLLDRGRQSWLAEVAGAAPGIMQKGAFWARNNGRNLKDAERLNGAAA
jgi:hypothetical protein